MHLADINPYLRYARVHPAVMEGDRFRAAYDYRLFYVLDGDMTFVTEEGESALTPATVLFVLPGVPYRFVGRAKVLVLNFDLSREHADDPVPRTPDEIGKFRAERIFTHTPPPELSHGITLYGAEALEPLLRRCVSESLCPGEGSDAITSALLKEALCLLLEETKGTSHEQPKIVQEITLYLRENFDRPLTNSDIAAAFGYHPFYLNRLFKEHTGTTLHKALLAVRIRNAKGLLKRTSLSVEEIVKESGFSDRTQFCIAFRHATGMTPSEYRKKSRT